ncbi:hypothetical protein BDB01DRAFT_840307 [Pilobolus umbonatus]|nr:hypothetical protein BDB01DRAFT_840307 [Pilobolus umbonatus]
MISILGIIVNRWNISGPSLPANQMALLSHRWKRILMFYIFCGVLLRVLIVMPVPIFFPPNIMFIYVLNLTETTSHGINECVPITLICLFSGILLLRDNQYYYG